jgi:deoxyguanosine kinase
MVEYLRKPDLIIYLYAPVDRLIDRILKRGRDFEQTIDRNYLMQLGEAYERWASESAESGIKFIRMDTEHKNFEINKRDLDIIVHNIREMERQSWLNVE